MERFRALGKAYFYLAKNDSWNWLDATSNEDYFQSDESWMMLCRASTKNFIVSKRRSSIEADINRIDQENFWLFFSGFSELNGSLRSWGGKWISIEQLQLIADGQSFEICKFNRVISLMATCTESIQKTPDMTMLTQFPLSITIEQIGDRKPLRLYAHSS